MVKGSGAFRKRITEMGFIEGQSVEVIKAAPLEDPVEYMVMNTHVSLRRAEAERIIVYRPGERRPSHRHHGYRSMAVDLDKNNGYTGKDKVINIALVGNPNCGKTTIFNRISRSNEHVGNY